MKTFTIVSAVATAAAALLTALPASAQIGAGEGQPGYPHELSVSSSADRAAVRAEAVQAVRLGRIVQGELGLPVPAVDGIAERAVIRAEAAEAVRLGLAQGGERAVVYTPAQLDAIRAAGLRAGGTVVAGVR